MGSIAAAAATIRLSLLGGFRLVVGGAALPESNWRRRKARSLVKLLALAPAHQLRREEVMEALWPDLDPAAADNNLRGALHTARRALAPHGAIVSQDGTLALRADGGLWIDAVGFEAAAATARRDGALADYAAALSLYGGELLPEDRYEDWATGPRDRLHNLHLGLLRELAALHEGARTWPAAIAALQRLLVAEPAHEEGHVALMRAYALAGQRTLALRQWDQLVAALRRELDAAPDAAARALHAAIVAGHFPPTEARPAAAGDAHRRHTLPIPTTALIGREGDLVAVKAALAGQRLVTLTGAGGVGKTRLALAAATDLLPNYPAGVWFVDLAPLADPAQVADAVAGALGVRESPGTPLVATLVERLASGATLLVLDNCEHLRAACADLAAALLAAPSGLRILATSRVPLGLAGEARWPVPALRLPPEGDWERPARALADLIAAPAARLFVERVRGRQPAFALTERNGRAVAEIARRLDGLPLALELAAARANVLTVEQVAARLGDALGLLAPGGRAGPGRQQTLRATLDWSYRLLTPAQQALLARLSVFAGGGTLDAVAAVCGDAGAGADADAPANWALLDDLEALVEHALVRVEADGDEARYRLPETVRQFAAERLAAAGAADATRERHAAHYAALVETATPHLAGIVSPEWLARLERDHDNLRAALRRLLDRSDAARALGLVGQLWRLWYYGGHPAEGRRWCAAALALPGADDPAAVAPLALALHGAARLAYLQGDYAATVEQCERALAVQRRRGDRREIAGVAATLGAAAYARQRYDEAAAWYAESLGHWQALGDRTGIAGALNGLGLVAMDRGDYPGAMARYEESLAILRALGDSLRIALSLNNLAIVVEYGGDFARAEALYRESLDRYQALGNREGLAQTHDNLGVTLRGRGDYAGAVPHHEAALAFWRALGNRHRTALALTNLGATLHQLGERDRAQALHEEGLGHARALGDAWLTALALENLGRLAWARGDRARATVQAGESLALYRRIDHSGGIITTLGDLGRAAQADGEYDQARAYYRESLERCERTRDRSRLPTPLEGLALLLAKRPDGGAIGRAGAVRLLGAAAALRTTLGKPPTPAERAAVGTALVGLRAALGAADCAAAWAVGQALAPDDALAAALALASAPPA